MEYLNPPEMMFNLTQVFNSNTFVDDAWSPVVEKGL